MRIHNRIFTRNELKKCQVLLLVYCGNNCRYYYAKPLQSLLQWSFVQPVVIRGYAIRDASGEFVYLNYLDYERHVYSGDLVRIDLGSIYLNAMNCNIDDILNRMHRTQKDFILDWKKEGF